MVDVKDILEEKKEAASGFEPENRGFADRCLTTWLSRRLMQTYDSNLAGVVNRI